MIGYDTINTTQKDTLCITCNFVAKLPLNHRLICINLLINVLYWF